MSSEIFTIGQLAQASGASAVTIRYYEKCNLLPSVARSEGGHRLYNDDALHALRFIQHAKKVGFNLEEIRTLLNLKVSKKGTGEKVKKLTLQKIKRIEQKITALQRMKHALESLANTCDGTMPIEDCPILKALEQDVSKKRPSKKSCCN